MALPKFTKSDGSEGYVWIEGSDLPGDRYDLAVNIRETNHSLEHQRHGVTYAREVLVTLTDLTFVWKNITQAMIEALANFYELSSFRYYPDSDLGFYRNVYIEGDFNPKSKRGGTFDLTISCKEI